VTSEGKVSKISWELQPDDELLRLYVDGARAHGEATFAGKAKAANKAHGIAAASYRELRNRKRQNILLPLLHSTEPYVRIWAAAHALEFAPEQGEPVLEAFLGSRGFLALDARMTLKMWREGNLHFP
jgi:hypothetical protein